MNFPRHPSVTKLLGVGPPWNRSQGLTYCNNQQEPHNVHFHSSKVSNVSTWQMTDMSPNVINFWNIEPHVENIPTICLAMQNCNDTTIFNSYSWSWLVLGLVWLCFQILNWQWLTQGRYRSLTVTHMAGCQIELAHQSRWSLQSKADCRTIQSRVCDASAVLSWLGAGSRAGVKLHCTWKLASSAFQILHLCIKQQHIHIYIYTHIHI